MSGRLKIGNVWKKAFMNNKAVEERTITDEELELVQNTDPISDPSDAVTTGIEGKEATTASENVGKEASATQPGVPLEEYERVKAERDQLFDRMARLQAEFDNARKREARERADFRDYAVSGAVEQFLPRARQLSGWRSKPAAPPSSFASGVELIVKQMDDVLRSLNVQAS